MSQRFLAGFAALLAVLPLASVGVPAAAQNFSDGYQLLKAVRDADATKASDLLSQPGSTVVNARDRSSGETGLHIAAKRRDAAWIRFLLQRGANPNLADNKGVSPLMIATRFGDVPSVSALLDGGARINDSDDTGETPLIVATHLGDPALAKVLLDHGANPDRSDNSGRSARDYARLDDNRRLLEAFAAHDASASGNTETYGPSL
ncbi:ankyrin repeat domain-containing protein [Erythrobacter sp. 3-20A1M]|uniref:ankyrin repeat domain-containing protein n=1 Tax=Erythrobacter sp. 3-20A1M TaxID=2653850 RepID=UPI00203DAEEA|nr:ankyrin repeat domain-containing protein [Erythrobacter sp. 3-20A1M]